MCSDDDSTWIALAAAARNVSAYLLLRKREAGSEANRENPSEPVPATGGQEAEKD